MSGNVSPTREIETSEFDFIDERLEEEFKRLQNELLLNSRNAAAVKSIKTKMRALLRENFRELKYAENVSIEKYMKSPKGLDAKKDFLKQIKTRMEEEGFKDFYLEIHPGKNGDDHIQIFSRTKEKEKDMAKFITKMFKENTLYESKEKKEMKEPKKVGSFSEYIKSLDDRLDKINKRFETINDRLDKQLSKHKDIKVPKITDFSNDNINKIQEKAQKILRKRR